MFHNSLYFNDFIFGALLGLQKNWAESTESSHLLFCTPPQAFFSPIIKFGINVVNLLQVMNQYLYIIN